jgi:hypothetical protein
VPIVPHHKKLIMLWNSQRSLTIRLIFQYNLKRWAGHVAHLGARRGAYRVLVGKPEGRRPLEGPRHRWDDNFKVDL